MAEHIPHAPPAAPDSETIYPDAVPVPVRRRALQLVMFVVIVFALDRVVGLGLGAVITSSQYRYSKLYGGTIDADVAVVGNSRGYHSLFTPEMSRELGAPVYNLSMNGLGIDMLDVIISDYLDNNRPPKMILIEITAADIAPGSTIVSFQPFLGESSRLRQDLRTYHPLRYWTSEVFHSYRYNSPILEKSLLYLTK
ncbi:MAG: hypothetical protein H7210_08025, partial [Pyrinomonadaceae bacterium]|nr:hypothetical protein [Phycisphaerales bacterium]